jgi:hypothetical protein
MRSVVQLPAAPIGYVRVQLGGREVGVPEHLLHRPEIGASLEQMRRERVPQEMRVNAGGVEPRAFRDAAQDQERSGAREGASPGVQEELGPVAAVEVRPAAGQVAAQGRGGGPPDRDHALLAPLPEHADEPTVEVDAAALDADGLGDAETRPVEELDERLVAQRTRLDAARCLDQALDLAGRERLRQRLGPPRQRDARGRVVGPAAQELQVAEEAPCGCLAARDRRSGQPVGPELCGVPLELVDRGARHRPPEERAQAAQVAGVRLDGARRAARGEQREEAFDLGILLHRAGFAPPGRKPLLYAGRMRRAPRTTAAKAATARTVSPWAAHGEGHGLACVDAGGGQDGFNSQGSRRFRGGETGHNEGEMGATRTAPVEPAIGDGEAGRR